MGDKEVLSIVCSNNSGVLRLLDSIGRHPALSKREVGSTLAELRKLLETSAPDILILDSTLPDGSGYELCREVKANESLAATRVILVREGQLDDDEATKTQESGANDLVSLPMHSDDFFCHLSQFTPVQVRAGRRIAVDMNVLLTRDERTQSGDVQNMSSNGLGVKLDSPIDLGSVRIALRHKSQKYDGIEGKVIWCRETPNESGFQVGLKFGKMPVHARELLVKLSLFQISQNQSGEGVTVVLQGGFDERTDFSALLEQLKGATHIDFMMQGVTYLSSCGVRSWCLFVEQLEATSYSFRNCSLAFAAQAAMVPMSIGAGQVVSMQAPYFCDTCDREENRLIESKLVQRTSGALKPPPVHCHICKKALVFDDIPERYFAFLGQ
jgi:CheY-like chemotaxis protein